MLTSGPQKKHACERWSSFIKRKPASPTHSRRPGRLLTRPVAAAALPSSLAAGRPGLRLFAPPPRPAVAAPARHRRAGSCGRRAASLSPTPARPRAPLAAVGGKARANNRGLAGKDFPGAMKNSHYLAIINIKSKARCLSLKRPYLRSQRAPHTFD